MRNPLLLNELMSRDAADCIPSTLEMFKRMGGDGAELTELLSQALATSRTMPASLAIGDMIAVLGAGALIGYYYALESLATDAALLAAIHGKAPS